jgi:hypothetical protein
MRFSPLQKFPKMRKKAKSKKTVRRKKEPCPIRYNFNIAQGQGS